MSVLKDIENLMSPEEIANNEAEYQQETAFLREARDTLAQSLAEQVSLILKDLNISQNEFRRRLGISSATMTEIVNGKGNPTLITIAKIASVARKRPKFNWE